MPRADTSGRAKRRLFVQSNFVYDAAVDHSVCPTGAVLTKSNARADRHDDIDHYCNLEACHAYAMRARCTIAKFKRWKHGAVLEAMQNMKRMIRLFGATCSSRPFEPEAVHRATVIILPTSAGDHD